MFDRPATRAGLAGLAVTGLVGSGLLFTAVSSTAAPGFEFERISGADRFETSTLVAEEIGDGPIAILANGQVGQFADALAANYLAGDLDAPILLTRRTSTPEPVKAQLQANGVESVVVVGGTAAVSQAQVGSLEDAGYDVTRIGGGNRYETNAGIIDAVGAAPQDTALIVTGRTFPDALASGPLAENGHPVALATPGGMSGGTLDALDRAGVTSAIVVGGEGAVGSFVVEDLEQFGIDVITRLAGDGRADTSVAVAEYAVANLGLSDTGVNLASGSDAGGGADALSGGVLTGQQGRPLLITQSVDNPSDAVVGYLTDHADTLTEGIIFGGDGAVARGVQAELEDAAQGGTTPGPGPGPGPNPPGPTDPTDPPSDPGTTPPEGSTLGFANPDVDIELTGTEVTVTTRVLDEDEVPVEGVKVDFTAADKVSDENDRRSARASSVDPGDEAEDEPEAVGTDYTDATGTASVTYTGPDDEGVKVVTAEAPAGEDLRTSVEIEFSDGIATVNLGEDDEREYTFISEAERASEEDDVITAVGEFSEDVSITRKVDIVATDAVLTGTIVAGSITENRNGVVIVVSSGAGSTITGLTIVSRGAPFDTLVGLRVGGVTLSGMTFEGAKVAVDASAGATGSTVTGSTFTDPGTAIKTLATDMEITGNTFTAADPTSDVYVDYSGAATPLTKPELQAVIDANPDGFTPAAAADEVGQQIVPEDPQGAFEPFLGDWSGTIVDGGLSYVAEVTMQIVDGEFVGSSIYPRFACGGRFDDPTVQDGELRVTEVITFGEDSCIDGDITFTRLGDDLRYAWDTGNGSVASGLLSRIT